MRIAAHAPSRALLQRSKACDKWHDKGLVTRGQAMSGNGENGKNGPVRDKPWIFRTYAGHSTAKASNELYRTNLSRGQTGLSIAFDLPTQTGYDSDHVLAK